MEKQPQQQQQQSQDDEVLSVATSRRSIGSLRSRLYGEELDVFEWIEAELHRQQRESGIEASEDGLDQRLVRPDGETPAQRQARRHKRHMEKHGPDFHVLFEELDPAERLIMMGLEKEIRLQRERTTYKGRRGRQSDKKKNVRNILPQHFVWRPKKRFAGGATWKDPTADRPGSTATSRRSAANTSRGSSRGRSSTEGGEDSEFGGNDSDEEDDEYSESEASSGPEATPGEIIGRTPAEQLQEFWMAYPGFERHHANLSADGFDDLEALMLATKEDLLDAGMGVKSATVLLRQLKKERPFWKVVFAAQREYNFYLRSLGHPIQQLLRFSPPPPVAQNDSGGAISEYTDSESWYSRAGGSQAASEIMSEIDEVLAQESIEREAGGRLAAMVGKK